MITPERIENDYSGLRLKRIELWHAQTKECDAKHALDDAEARALVGGLVDGKNAEARAANLTALTAAERAALRNAQAECRAAQMRFDTAQMCVDEDHLLVRLAELAGLPDDAPIMDAVNELDAIPFN